MRTDTRSPALTTALDYHHAWTSGDLDGAMRHVADDIVCRAPGQDLLGKSQYRSYLAGFSQMMIGRTDVAAFGNDEHVMLLLVFDRLSYAPPQVGEVG